MKIGIISFAHMHALSYAAALRDRKDVELSYIWDEDEVRGKEMAARYNCQYIASLDDFFTNGY